jgi:Fe-S-cluster containining protein
MEQLLPAAIPAESKATCQDCAMCAPPGAAPDPAVLFFHPDLKCCTYTPILWNFLVGRILLDPDPAITTGRASVERRISAGIAVTPLSLALPPAHAALYEAGDAAFGRSRALLCPHFDAQEGGRCGIWRHRDSTCATYFCKHDRGAAGQQFWRAIQVLLSAVERALARHAVLELDLGAAALDELFPQRTQGAVDRSISAAELDGVPDPARARRLWGRWAGMELEFYRSAAGLVSGLGWSDVVGLGGSEVRLRAQQVREAYRRLGSSVLPQRLAPAALTLVPLQGGQSRVVAYSATDPLLLPQELLEVLPVFMGKSAKQATEMIERDYGLQLTPELVRRLVDFGVLVECGEEI